MTTKEGRRLMLTLIAAVVITAGQEVFAQQADTGMLTDGQLHVVLCGTGSPLPDAGRASACVAVVAGGEFLLIDVGPNSWRTAALNRLPARNLSAVLLTHFHSDHFGDLGEAMTQSWIAGRGRKLDVYGPPGVERLVEGFNQAYSFDTDYRVAHHTDAMMPRSAADAIAHPVALKKPSDPAIVFERNGLKVTAFKVEHDPAAPAYGYRIDYRSRSVVVSGDTSKSANLAAQAAGADILIHDCMAKNVIALGAANFERSGDKRRAAMARDILTYHATSAEAAETAAAAKVGTLVLTHLVPAPNAPPIEQAFLAGLSDIFKGTIVLGKDGLRFDLAPKD